MKELWLQQVRGVLRLELRKNLFSIRALPIYLLAGVPFMFVSAFVLVSMVFGVPDELRGVTGAIQFYAALFQGTLSFLIYFGCVWIFMNLFRGEVLDRSLHYYFLSPIRREVLVAGKFLSGWLTATMLFAGSLVVSFVVLHGYLGGADAGDFLLGGPGTGHLLAYAGVATLACLGYGAIFLVVGLYFRNPIIPAVIIFLWEGINFLLPPLLKKISVVFYLQSMLPVPLDDGPFAVIADPVPAWLAVPGLLLFTALTLVLAGVRIRSMEISYGAD